MSDDTKHTPKALRSPGFPTLGLSEAMAKAKIMWDKETRHSVPADVIVGHWGYSAKSSGGKQALSSLLKYGLLEDSGANQTRRVKLSERALKILFGSPEEIRTNLREAALDPALHRILWDTYQGSLPSDETLGRTLLLEHKFNPSSVRDAIASYKDSLVYAGLMGETAVQEQTLNEAPKPPPVVAQDAFTRIFTEAFAPSSPKTLSPAPQPPSNPAPQSPMTTTLDGFLPIPLDCGRNALIPRGMSEDDFSILLETLKLWKRKIVKADWPKDAIWRNADHDQPVVITGPMGEKEGVRYFRTSSGTGIPEHELEFQ